MRSRNDVAEHLQRLLTERGIEPGQRLPPERQLASDLGVSRSSLREGMRRLLDLGILHARQGSGTYLAALDLDDLFEARLLVEPHAARLAAERRDADALAQIEGCLAQMQESAADAVGFAAADTALHAAITDASGSLALRVLLDALADLLRRSRARTATEQVVRTTTLPHVERLVRAIREQDPDAAEAAMRTHLAAVGAAPAGRGGDGALDGGR